MKFGRLLQESIEEGMMEVMGESATKAILYHMERNVEFGKAELAERPEYLAKGLEAIFGAGAPVLERVILRRLYLKVSLDRTPKGNTCFLKAVEQAEKRYVQLTAGKGGGEGCLPTIGVNTTA